LTSFLEPISSMALGTRKVLVVEYGVSDEAQGSRESRRSQSPEAVAAWRRRAGFYVKL
jgi:hypothetical protein